MDIKRMTDEQLNQLVEAIILEIVTRKIVNQDGALETRCVSHAFVEAFNDEPWTIQLSKN